MKTLTFRINGNFFTIDKTLPKALELKLQKLCSWCDPLDFTTIERYYSEGEGFVSFLPFIKSALETYKYKCVVVDETELSPKKFDAEFTKEFRIEQENLVNAALEHRICMLEAPPGYGKTVAFSAIVASIGKKALILTEDSKPCNDAIKTIKEFTTIKEVGELRGGNDLDFKEVNVALIQKLYSAFKKGDEKLLKFLSEVKVLIVDECHHSVAESYASLIYEMFDNLEYRIGMSATPLEREDGTKNRIKALLGDVAYKIPLKKAIDNEICVPAHVFYKHVKYPDISKDDSIKYTSVVKKAISDNLQRNQIYADMANHFQKEGITCAIIVDQHNHAYNLKKLIPNSEVVIGPDPKTDEEREELWKKLNNHEITCVISTLLDEAANIPSLGAVLIASNQKTQIRTIQRLRCTRSFQGKVAGGQMKKKIGYVFITIDHAPHVFEHSKTKLRTLERYLGDHSSNLVQELDLDEFPEVISGKF